MLKCDLIGSTLLSPLFPNCKARSLEPVSTLDQPSGTVLHRRANFGTLYRLAQKDVITVKGEQLVGAKRCLLFLLKSRHVPKVAAKADPGGHNMGYFQRTPDSDEHW